MSSHQWPVQQWSDIAIVHRCTLGCCTLNRRTLNSATTSTSTPTQAPGPEAKHTQPPNPPSPRYPPLLPSSFNPLAPRHPLPSPHSVPPSTPQEPQLQHVRLGTKRIKATRLTLLTLTLLDTPVSPLSTPLRPPPCTARSPNSGRCGWATSALERQWWRCQGAAICWRLVASPYTMTQLTRRMGGEGAGEGSGWGC